MSTTLPVALAPGFLSTQAAGLARELAQDIRPVPDILRDYGFNGTDDPAFLEICESRDFKRLLEEANREWNSADSTKKRIRLKSQAAYEMLLPTLFETAVSARDPKDRVEASKLLSKTGGFEEPQLAGAGGQDGGGVKIVINIGQKRIEKEAAPTTITPEGVKIVDSGDES